MALPKAWAMEAFLKPSTMPWKRTEWSGWKDDLYIIWLDDERQIDVGTPETYFER